MTDDEIVRDYNTHYNEAYSAWSPFYPLAARDLRFFLGNQWDDEEKNKLLMEGRNAYVFNLIKRNINLITGYQIKNRLSSVVVPFEDKDQAAADQMSRVLLHVMNYGDGYKAISQAFSGAIKTGINLLNLWIDYRDDPVNGDIRFSRDPYSAFIPDPYFTQLDFSDCSFVIKRKYLSVEQAKSLLPKQEKDIEELASLRSSRDNKFEWLPYQRQPDGVPLLAYDEYYRQGWDSVPMLIDENTGEMAEWDGKRDYLKSILAKFPSLKIVSKPKKYVDRHILINNTFMRTERNPFGLNEYPFVPITGVFESESDDWGLKIQSIIRCQIDPQRESNRRRSQIIDILDSNINSGWIAKKTSVINPRSLFQTSQGRVIWKDDSAQPGDIERIQPAQIQQGLFETQRLFDNDIMTIAGISDANFGMTENAQESGLMMMLRQGASIINMQELFDGLRNAQKYISRKAAKIIQTWTPEKIQRIIGEQPNESLYNPEFTKYDIEVQESVLTDTQRQIYFKQLVDLYTITGGVQSSVVTPDMLAKAAPLQGKTEFIKQIEENVKSQQQAAQQAAQKQQMLLQSELEFNKASSIEKIAGAKERFTRAVANMGLEDNRASEAVNARSDATLNKIKALKELQAMDDDSILKYMSIIASLEEMNKQKEQEIKKDDVVISSMGATGDEAGGMQAQTGNRFGQEQVEE